MATKSVVKALPTQSKLVLPPLKQLLSRLEITAQKKLSQNFLLQPKINDKIGGVAHSTVGRAENTVFIEVGPGPGGLTRGLLNQGPTVKVLAIEKDKRFSPLLEDLSHEVGKDRFSVVFGDALLVDEYSVVKSVWGENIDTSNVCIVGNLPFSVATRLLLKWIRMCDSSKPQKNSEIKSMTLMFQKEVAQRIAATPGTHFWTRLSVNVQNAFDAQLAFMVNGKTFVPPAKVDAGVVKLIPRNEPRIPGVSHELLERVCQSVFATRRKIVRHQFHLLGKLGVETFNLSGVDGMKRPEQLTWEDWGKLCGAVTETGLVEQLRPLSNLTSSSPQPVDE